MLHFFFSIQTHFSISYILPTPFANDGLHKLSLLILSMVPLKITYWFSKEKILLVDYSLTEGFKGIASKIIHVPWNNQKNCAIVASCYFEVEWLTAQIASLIGYIVSFMLVSDNSYHFAVSLCSSYYRLPSFSL